jgi:hypothetical protein
LLKTAYITPSFLLPTYKLRLLPSNGRCLQGHCLATGLRAIVLLLLLLLLLLLFIRMKNETNVTDKNGTHFTRDIVFPRFLRF